MRTYVINRLDGILNDFLFSILSTHNVLLINYY